MDALPPLAFRKNLERVAAEVVAGDWRVGEYIDLVSERKHLLFRLKPDRLSHIRPDVITFRAETAATLTPGRCAPILDSDWKNDRLDILTPFLDAVDPSTMDDTDARSLLVTIVETLDVFERYRFEATGLGIHSVGRDDSGAFVLMPNAYGLPPSTSEPGAFPSCKSCHMQGLGELMRALADSETAETGAAGGSAAGFRRRVGQLAEAALAGEVVSLAELYERLFDEPLVAGGTDIPVVERAEDCLVDVTDLASGLSEGAIVEVAGGPAAGKSRALCALRAVLETAGGTGARWVDEWDLSAMTKKRAAARDDDAAVWLIDDIDEKRSLQADLIDRLFDGSTRTPVNGAGIVFTLNRSVLPEEVAAELKAAKQRAANRYKTVDLDKAEGGPDSGRTLDLICGLLRLVAPPAAEREYACEEDAMTALLAAFDSQERQILELIAVAHFPLPHDIVLSVFSEANGELHKRIHRLAGLGLLRIDYRPLPPGGQISITLTMHSATIRRLIYNRIAEERKENLHRTVARMAEDRGGIPTTFVFQHLVKGRERQAAAKYGVTLVKETSRDRRAPFVDKLIAEFVHNGLQDELSFANRLYVIYELSAELLAQGRRAEAEALLLDTRETVNSADSEERRKNASAVCDTFGLLADAWAARGNYSKALTLLSDTKESLNPYLTLPAQARLLNEIGWLQYRLGDYDRAVESCKLSLNSLNANEYPLIVAQALNIMGVIKFNTSRYDEAITYYDQSAFLREREGDVNALSASYNNLGLACQTKGEYDKALEYYNKSLEIKRMQNNSAGIAAGCLNLALLYLEVRNFEEAEKNCNESLEICAALGNTRLTAENYCTLGDIGYTRGLFDKAEKHYQKSLSLSHSLETINEEMGAHRRLAQLYLTTERLAEARNAIDKAATLGRQIGSRYENARIEAILGDLDRVEGREKEAIQHYESAAASYTAASNYRLAAPVLARIGLIQFDKGNVFGAKQYLDRALDSIKSEIGTEIPDEIVNLQQLLRKRPIKGETGGAGPQKLLYAFYELSSLSDYADDRASFYKRALNVLQDLTDSTQCFLTLRGAEGQHTVINQNGDQGPLIDPGLRALCTSALQMGGLLDSTSEEIAGLREQIQVPPRMAFVCVPLRTMGRDLGCLICYISEGRVPLSKEDSDFLSSLGRHIAGDVRLVLHLEEHAHKEETLEKQYESLQAQIVDQYRYENLIGKDESMKKIFGTLEKVKDMDTGLLILGESGTGKTELARTVHYNSPRCKRPFQEIHCAEIPVTLLESELFGHEKGAFTGAVQRKLGRCEVADGGTVFLDDVNVVPSEIQTRLLHYLESKSFMRLGGTQKISTDVRIIAASNQDLEQLVNEGSFREDLYYRLKVILIELPPLRERREDMIAIAQAFLKKRCQAQNKQLKTLSPETIKLFQRYPWPGNVRELQNILEQVVLLSEDEIIEPSSLPEDFLKNAAGSTRWHRQSLQALARQMIESEGYSEANPLMPQMEALLAGMMANHVSSKSKAASLLGITKPTLYTRLKTYGKIRQS